MIILRFENLTKISSKILFNNIAIVVVEGGECAHDFYIPENMLINLCFLRICLSVLKRIIYNFF